MVDDIDIWRAAQLLIKQHGDTADIAAAQEIDAFAEEGDLDGAAVWRRIQAAVRELAKTEPDGPLN